MIELNNEFTPGKQQPHTHDVLFVFIGEIRKDEHARLSL